MVTEREACFVYVCMNDGVYGQVDMGKGRSVSTSRLAAFGSLGADKFEHSFLKDPALHPRLCFSFFSVMISCTGDEYNVVQNWEVVENEATLRLLPAVVYEVSSVSATISCPFFPHRKHRARE